MTSLVRTPSLRAATVAMVALAAIGGVAAAPAGASPAQESILMDDSRLVYGDEAGVNATLDRIVSLGADRLRISVFWEIVAPNPEDKKRPDFDAANPAAYPSANWDRYDKLVSQARARGLEVMFNLTSPAPLWATGVSGRSDIEKTFYPDPVEFGRFVTAVAKRYSGNYLDEAPAPDQPLLPVKLGGPVGPVLPRVSMWSIWNEPNQPGWLTPQWVRSGESGLYLAASPIVYRKLWDAAYSALGKTDHGSDTILLGETAPKGLNVKGETRAIRPLQFLRELYCLDRYYRHFTGPAAEVRECPTDGSFTGAHPGLFAATGFAHHPYGLLGPPNQRTRSPDDVTTAEMDRLGRALDRIFDRYSDGRRLPLYITEYGYQTDPPDPTIGVGLRAQSRWLDQAEYLAYRNPRIRANTQFLLYDDSPLRGFRRSDPRFWGSWQSGLLFLSGKPKPSYRSYQLPIWLPEDAEPKGEAFRIWGLLRTAPNGQPQSYRVQFRPAGRKHGWANVKTATTGNARNYFQTRFRVKRSGQVRVAWRESGTGRLVLSRLVSIRVYR